MSKEKQIDEAIEFLNNRINVERNSYFGKGCITLPLIEADRILDILKDCRKQSEGVWKFNKGGSGTCSECGMTQKNVWDYDGFQRFCGCCGAKMKGE